PPIAMTRSPSRRPAANAGLSARERRTLRPSGRISGSVISTRSRKRTSASSLGARSVALTDDDIGDTHVFVSDQPGCFNIGDIESGCSRDHQCCNGAAVLAYLRLAAAWSPRRLCLCLPRLSRRGLRRPHTDRWLPQEAGG